MTEDNIFNFRDLKQIERLKTIAGGLEKAKRLGFIYIDEEGIQSISTAGKHNGLSWLKAY